jgi:UDPglucose--hexose-1-phosphate uridylyltransferase
LLNNPLSPGAIRGQGKQQNPFYEHTYVFDNDFPALQIDTPDAKQDDDIFRCHSARGVCKVICFHPNSNLTLPRMSLDDIAHVVRTWINIFNDLSSNYAWVQIFENRGDLMGCSSTRKKATTIATC